MSKYIKLENIFDMCKGSCYDCVIDRQNDSGDDCPLEALPTIEVDDDCISRPRGKWITDPKNQGGFTPGGNAVMSCSCCGWVYGAHRIVPDYKYCPNCGAEMKGEGE